MKTVGLIGGMSWESTVLYYQIINRVVNRQLGGFHSCKCLLYSVDFAEIESFQMQGKWKESGDLLATAAKNLQTAGADCIVICTNTMHKVAAQVQQAVTVPLLHIAEMTALELQKQNIATVGLLGTRYTMEQDFYKGVLQTHGIDVLIPPEQDRDLVNATIFEELCMGSVMDRSRREFLRIVAELAARGAQGVILGCTEIGMLIGQQDTPVPLFDTTVIHATGAAMFVLEQSNDTSC